VPFYAFLLLWAIWQIDLLAAWLLQAKVLSGGKLMFRKIYK
jgi:hypothetical protein